MDNKDYGKIISKNLKRIAYDRQKSQAEIVRDLGINQATISSWMNGTRVPRMDKIDMLCNYFGCTRTELMEDARGYANTAGKANLLNTGVQPLFDSLNAEGQEMALAYIRFLLSDPKYRKG